MKSLLITGIVLSGLLSACGDEDDGGSGNGRIRFDGDALREEGYSLISSKGIKELIDDEDQFYATDPDDNSGDDGDEDGDTLFPSEEECPGFSEPTIRASGDRLKIEFAFDFAKACAEASGMEGDDQFYLSMRVDMHCPGENLTKYDGIKLSESQEVMTDDICTNNEKFGMAANIHIHMKSSSDENIFEILGKSDESLNGEPCYMYNSGQAYTLGECNKVDYSKSYWGDPAYYDNPYKEDESGWYDADDSGPKISLTVLSPKGLVYKQGDRYYSGGAFDFFINGWEGTMSYTGPDESPSYEAKLEDETISGIFSESDNWSSLTPSLFLQKQNHLFRTNVGLISLMRNEGLHH